MGKETNGSAKDRQRTDTQRHWVARPGPATNSYGDAEQCDAGQRRSKAAACNGDGLMRAAKALLCGAGPGEGKAKRGKAKAWLVRDLIGAGFGMQCNTMERHGSAERGKGFATQGSAWRWRGDETLCD